MSLSPNINDREKDKFYTDAENKTSVRQLKSSRRLNKLDFAVTELNSTEVKRIAMPENATDLILYHVDAGETAWLGNSQSDMTAGANTNAVPLPPEMTLELEIIKGQELELFGTVTTGTIKIYVMGLYKE